MGLSIPDLCDEYLPDLQVLEPEFHDYGGRKRFHGGIVTVKCYEDNSAVRDTLAKPGEGRVMVVDGGGSLNCALLGDTLAAMGAENGWQGIIINGCVRDVERLADIDFGVRALNVHPARSRKRGDGQVGVGVQFAGVNIHPGQYLYADPNGIVVADEKLDVDF